MSRPVGAGVAGTPGLLVALAALAAVCLWAGTVAVTKVAVTALDPLAVALLRTLVAGLLALPLAAASLALRPRGQQAWRRLGVSGLGAYVLFPILFSLGLAQTSGVHAALIMAGLPVFTGLFAAVFERAWPGRRWWLGTAIALAGTAWLILGPIGGTDGERGGEAGGASLTGDLLVLLGCLASSFGYVVGGRAARDIPAWQVTLWGLVLASILLLPLLAWTDLSGLGRSGADIWLSIAYLALASSLLAYALWYWALARGDMARTGAIQFLQLPIALGLAALILGEALTLTLLVTGAVILAGVWLAQTARRPSPADAHNAKQGETSK